MTAAYPICPVCRAPMGPAGVCPYRCDPALARPAWRRYAAARPRPPDHSMLGAGAATLGAALSAALARRDPVFRRNQAEQFARIARRRPR